MSHPPTRRQPRRLGTPILAIGALAAVLVGAVVVVAITGGGDDEVTVPNVVGLAAGDAAQQLVDLGLETGSLQVRRDDVEPGTVVAQEPAPGTVVDAGTHVQLEVAEADPGASAGAVEVPDVVGLPVNDAVAALDALGLVASTTLEARDDVSPGTVVGQGPEGGTPVDPGTSVGLIVAQEPAATETIVAWILGLAPGAPQGPPEFQAYELLFGLQCGPLAEGLQTEGTDLSALSDSARALYGGAAAACLAAFEGQADRWAQAESAVQQLDRPVSCLDVAAYDLLVRLVDAHRADPSARIVAATGGSGALEPPCPTITGLSPSQGPPGTVVTVIGINLDKREQVVIHHLDSGNVDDLQDPPRLPESFAVTVDGDPGSWACIVVVAATGWNASGVLFRIEEPAGPSGLASGAPPVEPEGCPPPSAP